MIALDTHHCSPHLSACPRGSWASARASTCRGAVRLGQDRLSQALTSDAMLRMRKINLPSPEHIGVDAQSG